MSVDLSKIIKITPTEKRPYIHLKGIIGSPTSEYWEEANLERCIAILAAGYEISQLNDDGTKTPLTIEGILNPPVTPSPQSAPQTNEGKLNKGPKTVKMEKVEEDHTEK